MEYGSRLAGLTRLTKDPLDWQGRIIQYRTRLGKISRAGKADKGPARLAGLANGVQNKAEQGKADKGPARLSGLATGVQNKAGQGKAGRARQWNTDQGWQGWQRTGKASRTG
jgi:hypothetical protein